MLILFCFGLALLPAFAQPAPRLQPRGQAGQFDYYVLSLSWSPQYCSTPAGERDPLQCGGSRRFGFVAHGLWPQYERGWPQFCPSSFPPPTPREIDAMLDIMPSRRLIQHEWSKHGVCSGLSPAAYLAQVRRAFLAITTPPEFQGPRQQVLVTPARLKQRFVDLNRLAGVSSLAAVCSGRFLAEVRLCLDRELRSRPCGASVRDSCPAPEIILQPLR